MNAASRPGPRLPGNMTDQDTQRVDSARRLIWEQELAIYQARGRGDLAVYAAAITPSYLAWPPRSQHPIDAATFRGQAAAFVQTRGETLEMRLTAFSLDGDTAIIYYETHRTRLPDGTPADERFDVVHVWLARDGGWRLFGGMARASAMAGRPAV
jgi:hypothetical protein